MKARKIKAQNAKLRNFLEYKMAQIINGLAEKVGNGNDGHNAGWHGESGKISVFFVE